MADAFTLLRPLIHLLPPEAVHNFGLWALSRGLVLPKSSQRFDALATNVFGLSFANPIGLAAGFDKNAVAVDALLGQGFGFVEAGTVTPLPQPGNSPPRIFRLNEDEAVVNRLGFNNDGLISFIDNFQKRNKSKGIAGANIGKNKNTADAVVDYVAALHAVYPYADYVTVNISSPNTEGLRSLQQGDALIQLLSALNVTRAECTAQHGYKRPMLLKVAPDLSASDKEAIAGAVLASGVDGLIVSNTTISRPATLKSLHKNREGGLSGKPLFALSTETLRDFYRLTQGKLPLVGVGGVSSAEDAYAKIRAGATLVQLYTALVYQGFGVANRINTGLAELLARDGFTHVSQAVGADAR